TVRAIGRPRMNFFRSFSRFFIRKPLLVRKPTRRRKSTLLSLELLERRDVPSTTWHVSSSLNSGIGSLREALIMAESGDSIDFVSSLAPITLSSPLTISTSVSIDGALSGGGRVTIDGNSSTGLILITGGTSTLSNLILAHGSASVGGAISNTQTTTIENCLIE